MVHCRRFLIEPRRSASSDTSRDVVENRTLNVFPCGRTAGTATLCASRAPLLNAS